jgi:hypothetical protein
MTIGQGSNRRYVNPGANHHMAIYAELDKNGQEKKWFGEIVSRFEAAARKREGRQIVNRETNAKRKFKFTLSGGDHVLLLDREEGPRLVRVTVISNERIEMLLHDDARPNTVLRKTTGGRIILSPNSLLKANAQKVLVAPLGELSTAND